MRLGLLRASGLVFAGVVVGASGAWLGAPLWREIVMRTHQHRYGELVFHCDNAMREHLIAKQAAVAEPTKVTVGELQRAELALLDCQDYDIYQKRLTQFGLTENELRLMRLKAIEARATTLLEVVKTHEIRY